MSEEAQEKKLVCWYCAYCGHMYLRYEAPSGFKPTPCPKCKSDNCIWEEVELPVEAPQPQPQPQPLVSESSVRVGLYCNECYTVDLRNEYELGIPPETYECPRCSHDGVWAVEVYTPEPPVTEEQPQSADVGDNCWHNTNIRVDSLERRVEFIEGSYHIDDMHQEHVWLKERVAELEAFRTEVRTKLSQHLKQSDTGYDDLAKRVELLEKKAEFVFEPELTNRLDGMATQITAMHNWQKRYEREVRGTIELLDGRWVVLANRVQKLEEIPPQQVVHRDHELQNHFNRLEWRIREHRGLLDEHVEHAVNAHRVLEAKVDAIDGRLVKNEALAKQADEEMFAQGVAQGLSEQLLKLTERFDKLEGEYNNEGPLASENDLRGLEQQLTKLADRLFELEGKLQAPEETPQEEGSPLPQGISTGLLATSSKLIHQVFLDNYPKVTKEDVDLMVHCVAADHETTPFYRNFYSADLGSEADNRWSYLAGQGLATCIRAPLPCADRLWAVTPEGLAFVRAWKFINDASQ